jgi:serine phosphatase RsbU (regulator of sigma subunit)
LIRKGDQQQRVILHRLPFAIGRRPGSDLVIESLAVSRDHALITFENGEYWLADRNSKHGTYINGKRVKRSLLRANDRISFGAPAGPEAIFSFQEATTAIDLLSHMGGLRAPSDLEKLSLLLEAARKLNHAHVLEDVLLTLLELTLRVTGAERAYVFLRDQENRLKLAAGRDSLGRTLADDNTISRSILQQAADSGCEFLLTDTESAGAASSNSIVAFDLRTVICIPLTTIQVKERDTDPGTASPPGKASASQLGVLYLDSHIASRNLSGISQDVLRAIASQAAALVENASLVQAEEAARVYQRELAIAASIQRNLMPVNIPQPPFARLCARNVPSKEVGGDFFDVIETASGLLLVIGDIAGKGISAALLASTLQGMLYSHLTAPLPLAEAATAVNRYLSQRCLESKYATLILASLSPGGLLEWVNCGHLRPLRVSNGSLQPLEAADLPVGLFADATYHSSHFHLSNGDRLVLYTDGITEAANAREEEFGEERLKAAILAGSPPDEILAQVKEFSGGAAMNDDCTLLELRYQS